MGSQAGPPLLRAGVQPSRSLGCCGEPGVLQASALGQQTRPGLVLSAFDHVLSFSLLGPGCLHPSGCGAGMIHGLALFRSFPTPSLA